MSCNSGSFDANFDALSLGNTSRTQFEAGTIRVRLVAEPAQGGVAYAPWRKIYYAMESSTHQALIEILISVLTLRRCPSGNPKKAAWMMNIIVNYIYYAYQATQIDNE
jgi:hypothetical protein